MTTDTSGFIGKMADISGYNSITADTSGFTDDISMMIDDMSIVSRSFIDIRECYVSRSGHARIFSARRFGKRYMLKCLKPDFLMTPAYRLVLNKEFEIGMQLDHPNICHTISMEAVPELGPSIVMEYSDGTTLETFMQEGKLTKELARKFVAQLTDALGYMHSKQMLHRDLKPTNVMVTHQGNNIKLIDFSLSDSDSFNIFKSPGGTSGYIAPELMQANARSDIRCDIYSLGVLMACMARHTGDKQMRQTAIACINHTPGKRPASMSEVVIAPNASTAEIVAVIFLTVTSIILTALIVYRLVTHPPL